MDWWRAPEGTPLYAPIPYVAPRVEEALSLTEQRVLRVITNLKGGARKQENGGYICDPGGYDAIAKNANVCRKTAYNVIRGLQTKGALRVLEMRTHGGQRVKTIYFAPSYADVLRNWRENSTIFKTCRGSVVVRGRAKRMFRTDRETAAASLDPAMEASDRARALSRFDYADDWRIDPKRAPKRGCGRGRNPGEDDQHEMFPEAAAAVPASPSAPRVIDTPRPTATADDQQLAEVLGIFQQHTTASLQDAIDLIAAARADETKWPWSVTTDVIRETVGAIASAYAPNRDYPKPTPMWFITRIAGHVAHAMASKRKVFTQETPARYETADRIAFILDACHLRDSGWASPEELKFCDDWLRYFARCAPDEVREAEARYFADAPRAQKAG